MDVWYGRLHMTISTLCFACVGALVKHIKGVGPLEKVWWRSIVSVVCTLVSHRKELFSSHRLPLPRCWKILLLRGACGHFALWMFFTAVMSLPVAEANVLGKVHPLAAAFFAFFFLGESLHLRHFIGTALSLVGVVLISNPSFSGISSQSVLPVLAAVASGVLSGAAYCCVRALNVADELKLYTLLSFPCFSIPFSMKDAVSGFGKLDALTIAQLLVLGVLTQGGQVFLVRGLKSLPCAPATQQMFVGSVFGVLLGVLMGEGLPASNSLAGGALILTSLYVASTRKESVPSEKSNAS